MKPTDLKKYHRSLGTVRLLLPRRTWLRLSLCIVVAALLLGLGAPPVRAQHPLEPLDTLSPRGTFTGFLVTMDEALRLTRNHFLESRTPDERAVKRVYDLLTKAERLFDVSKVPPDAQDDVSRDAAHYLYEVLSRIDLPPDAEIPDVNAFAKDKQTAQWTVPHTEITLARIEEGPRAMEFLFSSETVARAREFHERTRHLPYLRDVPLTNVVERRANLGGLLISPRLIEQLPDWTKQVVLGQGLWKWLTFAIVLIVGFTGIFWVHRLAHADLSGHGVGIQLRRITTPVLVLLLMQFLIYLIDELLAASGGLAEGVTLAAGAVTYLAVAWAAWLAAITVAEIIIASPRIPDQSLDAHMLRLAAQVVGVCATAAIIFHGANQIGLPLYGIIAGVGIGGLAIALAARTTLEDFLGSINIYLDRPVRVGDFCRYGDDTSSGWLRIGTVESIGLRSTKIRGIDRTITTIPNSEFARMQIVNLAMRDRMLLKANLHLRYDTAPGQLEVVLERLRALLRDHPRVTDDPARVRFIGFGDHSLNLEIFAYIDTSDFNEFLACQEDLNLGIMRIVEEVGTSLALPTRILYRGEDSGVAVERWEKAGA